MTEGTMHIKICEGLIGEVMIDNWEREREIWILAS